MRIVKAIFVFAFAAEVSVASSWFSKAAYNSWHETELERWLSDNEIPYPTPADRKHLEQLVANNWDNYAVSPYQSWSSGKLTDYLKSQGYEAKDSAESNKDTLLSKVKGSWYESEDQAQTAWSNVKDWILDSWTDSTLKSFCDYHGIPVPQPRQRDTLLQKARANYESAAQKAGEYFAYPGDWLYESWTESDFKEWLDSRGIPVPQPTKRDSLIAAVRRNSRLAYLKLQEQTASTSSSAKASLEALTDQLIDSWSESNLKDFCDKNGINVPQGTKENQLRALVRKYRAKVLDDSLSGSAASAFGAATSKVGAQYASAIDSASASAQQVFDQIVNTWSESRLKGFLDARGVPVPQGSTSDDLRALVRKNAHKASSGWNAWTFDNFSVENLKNFLSSVGDSAADNAGATRDELLQAAQAAIASLSAAGGSNLESATNYLTSTTDAVKKSAFDTWSHSELKSYLDSYGIPVHQGSTINELRAQARKQYTYFKYGTTTPTGTIFAQISDSIKEKWQWVKDQLNSGSDAASQKAKQAESKVKEEL